LKALIQYKVVTRTEADVDLDADTDVGLCRISDFKTL
jgi:hypothetical protein